MKTQKTYRTLITYLFICMFVVFVAGCGGSGSGDQAGTGTTPAIPSTEIDIEAVSGPIVAVRVGEVAILDDSRSFAGSTEALSYSWSFSHKPAGSNATLQGATTASPSFIADVRGVYMVQLVVSAQGISSQRAVTTVVVTNQGERRTGRFNHLGLSSNCVNCHNGVNLRVGGKLLFPKPPTHIASSNACQTCHTPQGFNIIPFADHQEVFGNCSQCHNGVVAIGKSDFHAPTNAECDDCHNTISFLELAPDGSFDHSNITRTCSGCHNGAVATGKTPTTADTPPGTHPVTNTECGYCHTTASFLPAYPDHTGPDVVGNRCDSCHNGGTATGEPNGHPAMNVDCESCHNITTFSLGGVFNHAVVDAVSQPCEVCHTDNNSINARGTASASSASAIAAHNSTTADCGTCHTTDSFIPAFNDHDGVVDNCQTCHGQTATSKSPNHMPTDPDNPGTDLDQDCVDCHTFGTFKSGTYDHANVVDNCASCHDNIITVGKLPNHISTSHLANDDCSVCHNTTSYIPALFDHTGISNNCESCHDGNITIGKAINHVPTVQDCSVCHAATDIDNSTFKDTPNFAHTGITGNCESCHSGNANHVAVGAIGKLPNHIPALNGCIDCHTDTTMGGFASSATFMSNVHISYNQGCEGCHTSKFLPTANSISSNIIKAANHLPTNQDCYLCHTNTLFSPHNFAHTDITGNCASCHDGSTRNTTIGAIGPTDTALHQSTNEDCGTCHNTTAFVDAFVDHSGPEVVGKRCDTCHDGGAGGAIGKNVDHLSTTQDCAVCHVAGGTFIPAVFDHTGIVDNCASCHNGTDATGIPQLHPDPLGKDCSACHNTTAFAGAKYDHTDIVNGCATCHDGATARGKTPPPNHVPTNGDCSDCHQTTGFRPATFDHVGIVDNCRSCHDGAYAIGKIDSHVPTNQDCGVCHTTSSFVGAGYNHTGIVDNCESCHDGATAKGKDAKTNPAHLATALDCHHCHTTATFVGGTWAHDSSSAGNCDQCHSPGGGARSKPSGHLSTNVQCDACHSTNGWAPSIFKHSSGGRYPGDHRRDPGCSSCHGNSIVTPFVYRWSQYAPDCAACHANDFESESDHNGGKSGTVEQNKNCAASGCHRVSDSNFD